MVKPVFRRKSIGTKVSEEEYARLEALAGGRALSEWVREVLLREVDGRQARPAEETLLAEVLALRTILLNAFYRLAEREKLTAEELQSFIDRADAGKAKRQQSDWQQSPAAKEKNNSAPVTSVASRRAAYSRLSKIVPSSYLGIGFMYSRRMWKSPLRQSLRSAPTGNMSQA